MATRKPEVKQGRERFLGNWTKEQDNFLRELVKKNPPPKGSSGTVLPGYWQMIAYQVNRQFKTAFSNQQVVNHHKYLNGYKEKLAADRKALIAQGRESRTAQKESAGTSVTSLERRLAVIHNQN